MNNNKSAILNEIMEISDENRLLEIFKKEDDFEIKYSIVNRIDDDSILYEIFSNEEDSIIKNIVLMKISTDLLDYDDFNTLDDYEKIAYIENHDDESLLFKFVENGKNFYVNTAAIYKIQDMDFIWKMANSHEDYDTRVVLYKKLKNKPLFEEISGENLTESRVSLVENLENKKFIKDIALNDSKSDVRRVAVEKIDDESVLAEIAGNDSDSDVRRVAVGRIDDESVLAEIARNDEDLLVRTAAIYRIQDLDILFKMANSHKDYDTRVVLYKKQNNQSITEEMTGENLTQSRIRLVKNLDNEKFIKDMVINDSDLKVKSLALKMLNRPNFYLNLLNSLNNDDLIQLINDFKDESQLMDVARLLSSDHLIVKHAINNIANPSVLFELYRRDPYIVRKTAMEKLVFGNVFSHEKITDIIGIEDIILSVCDKDLLAEIAKDGFSRGVRGAAVERIDDEDVLVDIARNDSQGYVRRTAVERIDDEEVLVYIARNDSDGKVRNAAVERIDDEEVLVYIARNDSDGNVRETAVRRIDDEEVLVDFARNDSDGNVRRTAILRIDDENVLVDIARNEEWHYICREAVGRINDKDFLADIARNDSNNNIRRAAVENIDDKDVLADIARNDSYSYVRLDAVRKINDNAILAEIARNDSENHVRKAAIECIDDEDVLAEIARNDTNNDLEYIARNDSNPNVRYEAVEKITNEDVLIDIARNEPYGYIREAAVKKINDEDILADIARNDPDYTVLIEAVEKITNEEVLADIARNNCSGYVREIALGKIRDCDTLQKLLLENFGYLPVGSYTSFKRNYHSMIYEQMGTGLYDYILDMIADESVFIALLQERLFGDFRVLIAERLVSTDVLRDLALNDLDYRVRLAAVRNPNLCDEETFAEIVQSDNNTDVRFEALRQIDNRDLLENIYNDLDPVMRIYALERLGKDIDFDKHYVSFKDIDLSSLTSIEDENVLYCIANDAPSAQLRRYAFDKIQDEHILADLSCHNKEFMNMALNKITDKSLLLNIALYCADKSVRKKAVKKIDDDEILLRAVQNNPCNDISSYIIDHIRDESILEIIALNNSNPFNRKAAVNRIKSRDILIRLGEVECEEMVCTAIVRKCRDKGLLEYVGLSNPCKTVRRHVGSVTDDDELLYRFALKEVEYDNRRLLISRLTNEEYILNLLKRETVDGVFGTRFRWSDFKITDTGKLVDLAKNGVSDVAKRYALENIKDQSVILDFIYSSPFISNTPENESVWDDFQYHRDDYELCLSIMADSNFNDLKVMEDFLIENEIEPCGQLHVISGRVWEIPSIYRIVLNCKSEYVRKLFKPKLEYRTNNHGRSGNCGNEESVIDEDEEAALVGFAALFGDDYGRMDDNGNGESVIDEDGEAALEGLGALFGDDYGRGDDDENSIMSNPDFNDLKVMEDFLIENEIEQCGQLSNISEKAWEIPSIYRIVLNCKSENVRKLFKPKLEYGANNHDRGNDGNEEEEYSANNHDRGNDGNEEEEYRNLGALFG